MAHYDVEEILENIEHAVLDEEHQQQRKEFAQRRKESLRRRSLFQKLENGPLQKLKEFHAVDRVPDSSRFKFFKQIFARLLRLVSAPQAAYNWSNLQSLQAIAWEVDLLKERLESLESGPARPFGMSHLAGSDTIRLSNLVEQHLAGLNQHVDHMSSNMQELAGGLGSMLETLSALSSRLNNLNANNKNFSQDVASAKLDISKLWTEMGLVYESLDMRAEDIWEGLDERDRQLASNTEAVQKLHGDLSSISAQTTELRARLLVLTEQLTLQQEMLENLGKDVSATAKPLKKSSQKPAPKGKPTAQEVQENFTSLDGGMADSLVHKQLELAYLRFQRQYRGDEGELRKRQTSYLDELASRLKKRGDKDSTWNVLDVACGEGIFLELAKERGWNGTGVDINDSMARQGQAKGLGIQCADAFDWMKSQESKQFDAISCFQFVEHLTPWQLMMYLKECYRLLKPSGLILIETINPHTLKALHWYHLDLTHERLIFPEMLQLLSETAGFQEPEWCGLNPVAEEKKLTLNGNETDRKNLEKLNELLFGDQDYYLIARRP